MRQAGEAVFCLNSISFIQRRGDMKRQRKTRSVGKKGRHHRKKTKTEQHDKVWLVAKWNKWHDVADSCILVTQTPQKKKRENNRWIQILPRLSNAFLHNRKDDSVEYLTQLLWSCLKWQLCSKYNFVSPRVQPSENLEDKKIVIYKLFKAAETIKQQVLKNDSI